MYKCIHGLAPSYLAACCQPTSHCAGHSNIRSANLQQLQVPRTKTCYGDRSFLVNGGPAVWNSLPVALRSPDTSLNIFKDELKTFLFRTECAFAALANLRGISNLIIIIIIKANTIRNSGFTFWISRHPVRLPFSLLEEYTLIFVSRQS